MIGRPMAGPLLVKPCARKGCSGEVRMPKTRKWHFERTKYCSPRCRRSILDGSVAVEDLPDSKPCARPGCAGVIKRQPGRNRYFATQRFCSRECSWKPGGQQRPTKFKPKGAKPSPESVARAARRTRARADAQVTKRLAAALPPAPKWRPAGFAPEPCTTPGGDRGAQQHIQ